MFPAARCPVWSFSVNCQSYLQSPAHSGTLHTKQPLGTGFPRDYTDTPPSTRAEARGTQAKPWAPLKIILNLLFGKTVNLIHGRHVQNRLQGSKPEK